MLSFAEYTLRPVGPPDAASLARYANNRKIWQNLRDRFPYPYTEQDASSWIESSAAAPAGTALGICTSTECIGGIGLELGVDVHRRTAELGYWLGEEFWGRGIMSQAVPVYVDAMQRRFDLLRIFAEPFATNLASARILEKSGFILEGRMRHHVLKDGQLLDSLLYAKTWEGS